MRTTQPILFLYTMFLFLNLASSSTEAASSTFVGESMSPAAKEAIAKSQRRLTVDIPRVDGSGRSLGHAFLINKEQGIILTAFHVINFPTDVILKESRVQFDGMPVTLEYINRRADIAFLKIKQVPDGMETVTFSKTVISSDKFFAKIEGLLDHDDVHFLMEEMVYVGSLRGSATLAIPTPLGPQLTNIEYLFMQPSPMFGFSGSMVVNEKGTVVGMMAGFLGGYAFVCSAATIESELQQFYQIQKTKEETQKQQQEATPLPPESNN